MYVVLPHLNEILRTNDEGLKKEIIFKEFCERGCGDCLPKTNHITDQYAVAFVQMVCSYQYCFLLEFKQLSLKHAGQLEFRNASPGFSREVIRHFEVDVVRGT